jgi:release factor glutamine methyltransferase
MKDTFLLRSVLQKGASRLAPSINARRDAELLLLHTLGVDRAWLLAHPEAELTDEQQAAYAEKIGRRAEHEPVQYILGEQEFYGLKLRVTPDVLIPRPETEHLVDALLARVARNAPLRIADVGTGSGAIAVALAAMLPEAQIVATEISAAALTVAHSNAVLHHVAERIRFVEWDLLAGMAGGESFDAIVSNPPYVPEGEPLEAQVRDYEPHAALFAGADGLDTYPRLIPQAKAALTSGGWLLMEIGYGQRNAIATLLSGWDDVSFVPDLQGIPRVACARKP